MKKKKQTKSNKRKKNNTTVNMNGSKKVNKPSAVHKQNRNSKAVATAEQNRNSKPAAVDGQNRNSKVVAAKGQKRKDKPPVAGQTVPPGGKKKSVEPVSVNGQRKTHLSTLDNGQKKADLSAVENGQKKADLSAVENGQKKADLSALDNGQKKIAPSVLDEGADKDDWSIKSGGGRSVRDKITKKQERDRRQKKETWREVLYNCPYLIVVLATSFVVMICSEEIGIRAIAAETKAVVQQTMGSGTFVKENSTDSEEGKNASDPENGENSQNMESAGADDANINQNAGECKPDSGEKNPDNNVLSDGNDAENSEKIAENEKGITRFEYYDPQKIESRYYSDAGKVALTTEYHYTQENISYFNDAAFLGDSRTLGISDYAGFEEADFYCDSGMTIFKLLEEEVTYQKTGDKVDLTQVLQAEQYGKIYIMLGMNELGYGNTDTYLEQYRKVVDQIREWQPNAIIYVMANLHVSREKNNMESEFNNININDKNAAAALLANGTDVFYLDANPLFTDGEGFLNAELTFDGVHLYAQHYDLWREFLLEHAVEAKAGQNQASEKAQQPEEKQTQEKAQQPEEKQTQEKAQQPDEKQTQEKAQQPDEKQLLEKVRQLETEHREEPIYPDKCL